MPEPTIWENMSSYMGKYPRFTGALSGAAVGGLAGAMMDNEDRWRGGLLGASAGGVIGYGAGTIHDLSNKNTALTDTNKGLTGQVNSLSTTAQDLKKKFNLASADNAAKSKTINTLTKQNKSISQESDRLQAALKKKQQRDKSYQTVKGNLSLAQQAYKKLQKEHTDSVSKAVTLEGKSKELQDKLDSLKGIEREVDKLHNALGEKTTALTAAQTNASNLLAKLTTKNSLLEEQSKKLHNLEGVQERVQELSEKLIKANQDVSRFAGRAKGLEAAKKEINELNEVIAASQHSFDNSQKDFDEDYNRLYNKVKKYKDKYGPLPKENVNGK